LALKSKLGISDKKVILGSANIWDWRKGLSDFIELNKLIDKNTVIILIGLTPEQIKSLPSNMIGIERTDSIEELASYYNLADVYVNPTYVDNFPTTNLEALSSGTPVITYKTGGSPEAIDEYTGFVLEKGDIEGLKTKTSEIIKNGKDNYSINCRNRGLKHFNKQVTVDHYFKLYERLLSNA
jgi:putative colanic acid biosynthesis glycosyltransferase